MNAKILAFLIIGLNSYLCYAQRRPRIYNALITTDENLISSRAYPVIQPTIHETRLAQYPFGPYAYSPFVRFGQPVAPGLGPRQQLPYPLPQSQFPPQFMRRPLPSYVPPQPYPQQTETPNPPTAPAQQPTSQQSAQQNPNEPPTPQSPGAGKTPQDGKVPIPLNEYGLPPSLIPLSQYPHPNANSVHLPPYGFNPVNPLGFNSPYGYRDNFLPPYDYLPNHMQGFAGPQPTQTPSTNAPTPTDINTEPSDATETDSTFETTQTNPQVATTPSFDSIKNASNKPKDIPDVPPPPIPAGKPKNS
ncbi:proline-rich receptor-like protein kinase PERK9 [Teleopsis dalmanni]|uniref:proline-rich receptor-like protein kinase PERK9 n=1 Tax=Teleopsis dalmanni TaxID=139649 RepID=UPI0018CDD988|nr:proline-rich receptor-like protein kinase PERK9 [Teleopsis dalmanni]